MRSVNVAEFDRFAEEYNQILQRAVAVTGEGPEFFHEYKVNAVSRFAQRYDLRCSRILDFGSGVGNSITYFRRYFPDAQLAGADISERSLEIARARFPATLQMLQIAEGRVPAEDNSFSLTFSACAFHHIPEEEHVHWLSELRRLTRPGGMLVIFEHNPMNPLTVKAVNTCPFDEKAKLIRARVLAGRFREAGWTDLETSYHLFFPRALSWLRWLEPWLSGIPFGGQYSVVARKSS